MINDDQLILIEILLGEERDSDTSHNQPSSVGTYHKII